MPCGKSIGRVRGAHGRLLLPGSHGGLRKVLTSKVKMLGEHAEECEILRAHLLPAMRRRARIGRWEY